MKSFAAERWHGIRCTSLVIFKSYVPERVYQDEDIETFLVQPNLLGLEVG